MKKLSIITINLNNSDGLQKTIESVVIQTFQNFEYIVIDGASTDNSVNVINEYAERITYWLSESDSGIYNAMNKGIRVAKGEYLLFLNSGDVLCSQYVLDQMLNNHYTEDMLIGNKYCVISNRKVPWHITIHHGNKKDNSVYGIDLIFDSLPHQASFIKKELFIKYGLYDETLQLVSDWKFTLDVIINHNITTRLFRDVYVCDFNVEGRSMNSSGLMSKEINSVLKSYFPAKVLDDYNRYVYPEYIMRKYWLSRVLRLIIFKITIFFDMILSKKTEFKSS